MTKTGWRWPFALVCNVDTLAEHLGPFEQAILLSLVGPRTELGREGYGRSSDVVQTFRPARHGGPEGPHYTKLAAYPFV
jgi:hypothetical protein